MTKEVKLTLALVALASTARAHGGLAFPVPRNNFGNVAVTNLTYQPGSHIPSWQGGSCAGDMCLWFNEGCFIGCENCSSEIPTLPGASGEVPDRYIKPNCKNYMAPTLPEYARSWNIGNRSVYGDWTRTHPWRAPGHAPVADPCGVAGGTREYNPVGGETPLGAKQFAPGSALPKLNITTEWVAGSVVEAGWMIGSNHGGGYLYSLCPADQPLTEECFQAHPLPFVGTSHVIRFLDSQAQIVIPAVQVSRGTMPAGSTWRRNPIPACNCDAGKACGVNKTVPQQPAYPAYYRAYADEGAPHPAATEPCETGTQFAVPFERGYGQHFFDYVPRELWAIVDQLQLPKNVTGDYVLRWRWDTEQNPQIWTHCADVKIVQ